MMAARAWVNQGNAWLMNGARCPQFEGLETPEVALKEDGQRVAGLRQRGAKPPQLWEACEELANRICQRRMVPETLASKRYMRVKRAYITAELLKLLGMVPNERVYLMTLIPVGHALTIDELMQTNPAVPKLLCVGQRRGHRARRADARSGDAADTGKMCYVGQPTAVEAPRCRAACGPAAAAGSDACGVRLAVAGHLRPVVAPHVQTVRCGIVESRTRNHGRIVRLR